MILAALSLAAAPPQQEPPPPPIVVRAPLPATPQTPATMVAEPVAMMIAACDADGDAMVDRSELTACVRRSFEAADTAHEGSLRYIAFADWAERWLGDRNALPSPFEIDRDGDNRITLEELLTYRTAPIGANGPPAPRPEGRRGKRPRGGGEDHGTPPPDADGRP